MIIVAEIKMIKEGTAETEIVIKGITVARGMETDGTTVETGIEIGEIIAESVTEEITVEIMTKTQDEDQGREERETKENTVEKEAGIEIDVNKEEKTRIAQYEEEMMMIVTTETGIGTIDIR